MKISDKDIAYLKKTMSAQDLVDLVAMKHKMNERARKTGNNPMNETQELNEFNASEEWVFGFKKFCNEYLTSQELNQVKTIFSKLSHDVVNQRFLQTVYSCMSDMIDKVDQEMIDNAN
jgi:hypothetical protein